MMTLRAPLIAVTAGLFLGACALALPPLRAPTTEDRIAAECRLLASAATRMATQGLNVHEGLREGCSGVTAVDTRPLPAQTASLRAATAAGLPAGVQAGSRAEVVFRRMITRGVPPAISASLTNEPDFLIAGSDG